jgi:riboflavin kinase / FMN adenylyltransferase
LTTRFIHGLERFPKSDRGTTVVTIGTFDGIHRGHRAIFQRVRAVAEGKNLRPVLITFHPHPRMVVTPDNVPMLLTTIEEKGKFVPHFFDGSVLVLEFNKALMNLTAEEFVRQVLVDTVGVKHLVVGYDHGLGKNRSGTAGELRRLGEELDFEVEVVPPVEYNGTLISSTKIREAMTSGRYSQALELLGHDYAIYGTVERGIGLGRKLGYPTANVKYSHRKLLPPKGVYACWAQIGSEEKHGMMFIGQNHFNPVERLSVEANLFDFDRDIYDEEIMVYPTHFIRENQKFEDREGLIGQIRNDKKNVIEIIGKGERTCQ